MRLKKDWFYGLIKDKGNIDQIKIDSKEIGMNIYDTLNSTVTLKKRFDLIHDFPKEKQEELDTTVEKNIYNLIKNMCSMSMDIKDGGVEFSPGFIFDGKRTFSLEDISEDEYNILLSLDHPKLPLNVRARICDILWVQKRNYKMAIIAAESYYELFNLLFNDDDWVTILKAIKRAAQISLQINKTDLHEKICKTIYDHLIRINGVDTQFLSILLIEFLMENSYGDTNNILAIIDKILLASTNNPNKMERAFELKFKYKNRTEGLESATTVNIDKAKYLVDYAEQIYTTEQLGAIKAESFFQKAILLYRNNGKADLAVQTHRRLVEIQKDIYKSMVFHKQKIDVREIVEKISKFMEGFSFEECVVRLSKMTHLYSKQEGEKAVIKDLADDPFSRFFATHVINIDGQTVSSLRPLDIADPHKDADLLESHIHRKLFELEDLVGNLNLRFAFDHIREKFDITKQSFNFIFNDNIIVPIERRMIIEKGIRLAFEGDFYTAIHILAPQTENIFRHIAKMAGALTVTLENDGSSKQKTLTSIFDLPELLECYDNDIIFLFKGLLNEQSGANIRNEVAHGIMEEAKGSTGTCIYFISALIKLLVISSPECWKILYEMNKTKFSIEEKDVEIQGKDDKNN